MKGFFPRERERGGGGGESQNEQGCWDVLQWFDHSIESIKIVTL